jgi:hypothetical protein
MRLIGAFFKIYNDFFEGEVLYGLLLFADNFYATYVSWITDLTA